MKKFFLKLFGFNKSIKDTSVNRLLQMNKRLNNRKNFF